VNVIARAAPPHLNFSRKTLLAIAAAAAAALIVAMIVSARPVAQGWLIGFVVWSSVAVGSLVLLLIHRLTGGRWGDRLAPALVPCVATLPLGALAFLPLAFGLSAPYRWAAGTANARPDLVHLYLNEPAFLLRTLVALIGWSILAVLIVQRRCNPLMAAIGLAFHGFIISVVAVDWILSIDVGFGSSAFAAGFAIQQILSALAFTAVVAPEPGTDTATDLGSLLMAALLGTVYIDLMSFIVSWYGDLPDKAAWYLRRGEGGWNWVILSAVVIGALVPVAMLMNSKLRANRRALRLVGALILVGVILHILWLMAPSFEPGAIVAALGALIALASASIAVADPIEAQIRKWSGGTLTHDD
jgi:hypothetical protein